jgi:hypothetical protein
MMNKKILITLFLKSLRMNYLKSAILQLCILFSVITYSHAQLYINEFSASNTSIIKDPDYNDDADWIEIYNAGSSAIDLKGYYLTDNLKNPSKWKVPTSVTVAAGGCVLFWADGRDITTHTSFKLAAEGEEIGFFNSSLQPVDSIIYKLQQPNVSTGRNKNNISAWGFFTEPTPGTVNTTPFYTGFAFNAPTITPNGGLYSSAVSVSFFNDLGGEIRYTLDGSEPTLTSTLYSGSIQLNATKVVRARIFKPNMVPGPIVTQTYFIDQNIINHKLPVVSLATNPANFWDSQIGIYAQGDNFKPSWEVPTNIELYENNDSHLAAFNEMSGVQLNGLYSWKLPQKMLGVYFKKQYGSSALSFPIFSTTKRNSFKCFSLRASGNDWSNTLIRDILGHNATLLNMGIDIMAYRWCVVYVNGQYMGIHNFREKVETDYIQQHYNLEAGTFDLIGNEDTAEVGDLTEYNKFHLLTKKDLSVQANYDTVAKYMDIQSLTDYAISEIASGNTSIDHNVMAWKPKNKGKWKWILMDLDRGYYISNISNWKISSVVSRTEYPLSDLMQNSDYNSYFTSRLADQMYTSFNPQRMYKLIEDHQKQIEIEIPNHVQRWLGTTSSYGNAMPSVDYWYNELAQIKLYVKERQIVILNDLSNYGLSGTANFTLAAFPYNGGSIKFNNLIVPESSWSGLYIKNIPVTLTATESGGYTFKGWVNTTKNAIIPKGADWKYLDNGTNAGSSWKDTSFNDGSWKSGPAELGYGESEKTVVSYGSDAQNKYITTYFRKQFALTESDLNAYNAQINMMIDDGAVVYINGVEAIRDNITTGTVNYQTTANTDIASQFEGIYYSFIIDKQLLKVGKNTIAVELHQKSKTNADLSFDLELALYMNDNQGYLSTSKTINTTLTADKSLAAVFEPTGQCIVPELISSNTKLSIGCSPYIVQNDVTIAKNATLTIEPGVEIWMSENSNCFIHGNINAIGTADKRIIFKINPQYEGTSWGALNFEYTTDTSHFNYVTIEHASKGPVPIRVGAISGYYTTLRLDHLLIENTDGNPIASRYSDVSLTNSYIHNRVVSDAINIKYGKGYIDNCEFHGNPLDDADGIDYDGIENGVIKNTRIYDISGFNADAIDVGEETKNLVIDSVLICNAFDKGVSNGQRSTLLLKNSTLINCNMGLGIKDSSLAIIDHVTFYGNVSNVSCYEKNIGRAGGNAIIKNSILSNATDNTYSSDNTSTIKFYNSISDNDSLPVNTSNLYGDPRFADPTNYDFSLLAGSPCIHSGNDNGVVSNMGAVNERADELPNIMICRIFINAKNKNLPEFIALYNPSDKRIDVSNYSIDRGVTCVFPEGASIGPGDTIFITDNYYSPCWWPYNRVLEWSDGKLSNNGESIRLLNNFGIPIDFVRYENDGNWPTGAFTNGDILSLISSNVDNHFAKNWTSIADTLVLAVPQIESETSLRVYPNPAKDKITVIARQTISPYAYIYSITGQNLAKVRLNTGGQTEINLTGFNENILLVRVGNNVQKIIRIK